MSDMLALLPARNLRDTLFLCHFLRRLPISMRVHLAAADCDTAEEMAVHADRLWDVRASQPISHVTLPDEHVAAVTMRSALPGRGAGGQCSPDRSQQRGQSSRRGRGDRVGQNSSGRQARSSMPGLMCRLHAKWGAKSHSCIGPCSLSGNYNAA